ncbi:hypothetical protein ES703_75394 [subsurface metagenome]
MGWMSPKELNENPKRWLDTPHEAHKALGTLMEKLFPGFKKKLKREKVHCLLCEGVEPFEVVVKDTLKLTMCDGYIGDKGDVELLHTKD